MAKYLYCVSLQKCFCCVNWIIIFCNNKKDLPGCLANYLLICFKKKNVLDAFATYLSISSTNIVKK